MWDLEFNPRVFRTRYLGSCLQIWLFSPLHNNRGSFRCRLVRLDCGYQRASQADRFGDDSQNKGRNLGPLDYWSLSLSTEYSCPRQVSLCVGLGQLVVVMSLIYHCRKVSDSCAIVALALADSFSSQRAERAHTKHAPPVVGKKP